MNRCLAFLLAVLCASLSVASACTAAPSDWVRFTLQQQRGGDKIRAAFRDDSRDGGQNNWSTAFPPSQLIGLDLAGFRAVGARPVRFAVVREAGRLDCTGNGGNSSAAGTCSFTADPDFTRSLQSRGIGHPTRDQAFGLMALDVRRELIDAVAAARYPTPTIAQLTAMTAVGVTAPYIGGLARVGYRPASLDRLVEFRALNITPDFIGGFTRIGYAKLDPDDLVQLRALDVTPEFVADFERIGYRNLSVETLVQLKALDITPEFVRSVERDRGSVPPVGDLVQLKVLGPRR